MTNRSPGSWRSCTLNLWASAFNHLVEGNQSPNSRGTTQTDCSYLQTVVKGFKCHLMSERRLQTLCNQSESVCADECNKSLCSREHYSPGSQLVIFWLCFCKTAWLLSTRVILELLSCSNYVTMTLNHTDFHLTVFANGHRSAPCPQRSLLAKRSQIHCTHLQYFWLCHSLSTTVFYGGLERSNAQ